MKKIKIKITILILQVLVILGLMVMSFLVVCFLNGITYTSKQFADFQEKHFV